MTGRSIEESSKYELFKLSVQYVDEDTQIATVAVKDRTMEEDNLRQETSIGKGSIAAVYNSIEKLMDIGEVTLHEYRIDAVTEGIDAQAQVHVVVENQQGHIFNGMGIDRDVIGASAKAYLQALEQSEGVN